MAEGPLTSMKDRTKAIAFLGGGRITGALAAGLRLAGYKGRLVAFDRNPEKLRALQPRIEDGSGARFEVGGGSGGDVGTGGASRVNEGSSRGSNDVRRPSTATVRELGSGHSLGAIAKVVAADAMGARNAEPGLPYWTRLDRVVLRP